MLSLHKLEIFAQVVEAGSFSAAATRLLLTQPAVSQHIQELEASLGAQLFVRQRRGVKLTQAGETLHGYTLTILRLLAEAEAAVTDVRQLSSGQVRVAATPGVGAYLMPEWVQGFGDAYPRLSVSLRTGVTAQLVADVLNGAVELAIIEGELDTQRTDHLAVLALQEVEQLLVVGAHHVWGQQTQIALTALNGQPFVMRQRLSQTRIWLEQALQQHHVNVRVIAEFDNVESIKRAVALGAGLAILPPYAVRDEVDSGQLHTVRFEGAPLSRTLKLLWRSDRAFSAVGRAFLRFLEPHFAPLRTAELFSGARP